MAFYAVGRFVHQVKAINGGHSYLIFCYNFYGMNPFDVVGLLVLSGLVEQHQPTVVPTYPYVAILVLPDWW